MLKIFDLHAPFFLQMAPSSDDTINHAIERICTLTKADIINSSYDQVNNITRTRIEECVELRRLHCQAGSSESTVCRMQCSDDEPSNSADGQLSMPQFCLGQIFYTYAEFARNITTHTCNSPTTFIERRKSELLANLGDN